MPTETLSGLPSGLGSAREMETLRSALQLVFWWSGRRPGIALATMSSALSSVIVSADVWGPGTVRVSVPETALASGPPSLATPLGLPSAAESGSGMAPSLGGGTAAMSASVLGTRLSDPPLVSQLAPLWSASQSVGERVSASGSVSAAVSAAVLAHSLAI
jgi:hypothetical protein